MGPQRADEIGKLTSKSDLMPHTWARVKARLALRVTMTSAWRCWVSSRKLVPWFYLDGVPSPTLKAASMGKLSSALAEMVENCGDHPLCLRNRKGPCCPQGNKDTEKWAEVSSFPFRGRNALWNAVSSHSHQIKWSGWGMCGWVMGSHLSYRPHQGPRADRKLQWVPNPAPHVPSRERKKSVEAKKYLFI